MREWINLFEAKDVTGNVDISDRTPKLIRIPEEYGIVTGNFDCSQNEITSLEGSPRKVGGNFYCYINKLTNLIGGPEEVTMFYSCEYNNLISLEGSPRKVGNNFWCNVNQLTNLIGGPEDVGWTFNCENNKKLISLEGCPLKIDKHFYCSNCPLLTPYEMRYILFSEIGGNFKSSHEEANKLINNFIKLNSNQKQEQFYDILKQLEELS